MKKARPIPVDSLKIGSCDVAIKPMSGKDKKNNWGLFYCFKYEIHLQNEYPTKCKAGETALHEVFHVIWEERGLQDGDREERIVTALSRGLFAMMRDNPEFRDWLVETTA